MGIGKVLGFATLGVAAVALAPFTGGGSVAGAATLAASLAGAEAVAAGAAAAGAGIGYAMSRKEEEEKEEQERKISELKLKADKLEKGLKETINRFQTDKKFFDYIIALSACGIAMANADGEISEEEKVEIDEFIGGVANSEYPDWVKQEIENLYKNPPNVITAMQYLEKVQIENRDTIKELLVLVMEADGRKDKNEMTFLEAFERSVKELEYKPSEDNGDNHFIKQIQQFVIA